MHPLFKDLPQHAEAVINRISRNIAFDAGATLCHEGDPADEAWFLIEGEVEVSARMPGGGEASLCTAGPGAVLGELALVHDEARRSATVTATTPVRAWAISRDDLNNLFSYHHPASLDLMRRLSERVSARIVKTCARLRAAPPPASSPPPRPGADTLDPGCDFEVRPFLAMLPFFRGYSADDIGALFALGRVCTAARGALLYTEGAPAERCYLVIRGALATSLEEGARPIRLAIAGPGACMGVMSMLMGSSHTHTCQARETSVLLALDAAVVARLDDPSWRVSYRFHRARMRGLMETLKQVNRALTRSEQQTLIRAERWAPRAGV